MRFDVLRRAGGSDEIIVSFTHHFDPPAEGFDAVRYEADAAGAAVDAAAGDLLVLRVTAVQSSGAGPAFIPNADGRITNGRIPSLTLP